MPNVQPPRWMSATRPGVKPAKSAAVQPLAELGVVVAGTTMPPAGCRAAVGAVVPPAWAGSKSVPTVKVRGVGDTWEKAGGPRKVK